MNMNCYFLWMTVFYTVYISKILEEIHNSHLSEQSERGKELRSISAHLTQIQNQLQDIEDGLTVIRRLIDEGVESIFIY